MTTLAITPNWKNKTARFKGTIAAGEHVSVSILNENGEGGEFIADASNLRLRVVNPCNGRTLAIFPEPVPEGETPEEWDSDLSPLRCTLNLNTVQMLKAVPPAANVPLLFVLDAYREDDAETEAYEGEFTLYFKDLCEVTHWPRRRGEEEPTNLDDYKDIIADFNTRLTAAEETVTVAAQNAQSAAASASAAASSASTAATAATDAQTGAIAAKNAAQSAAESAATAKTAAETAQGKAEDAQEAAETAQGKAEEAAAAAAESAAAFVVDDTLSVEGAAADAKAVGDANQDLITRIETVQDNLDDEVAAREELDSAVQVDRQNLANEIARAQSTEQTLDANKADKATTYTKSEIDAKWAGFVDGAEYDSEEKKIILTHGEETIAEIDATDFIKDGMVSSVKIEDGKLVITFNTDAGLEPIEIPLTDIFDPDNYYTKTEANALLAGKASKADATLNLRGPQHDGFSAWSYYWNNPYISEADATWDYFDYPGEWTIIANGGEYVLPTGVSDSSALSLVVGVPDGGGSITATRTALGYVLGPDNQSNPNYTKPLATAAQGAKADAALPAADVVAPSTSASDSGKAADAKATGDALAGKLDKSGGEVTGSISMVNGALDAGDVQTRSLFDFLKPGQLVKSLDAPENSGKALTDADLQDSSSALGAALAAKADDADVVHTTGDETIGGVKTFDSEGIVVQDSQTGFSMKLLDTGIAVTDGTNTVYFYVPSIAGGGGTFALLSDVMLKADRAPSATAGNLAALDANGNPVDSDWTAGDLARYALVTKSIDNGAVTLDDRAINAVAVSSSLASLTVNFPAATSGKAHDFGVRLTVASGITTAPQLVLPQGVTCENADGTAPEIGADGATTLLYFTETAANVFLVKGETVTAIA